jgi:fucose 4-O-acetylase-like acetyltransferase
MPYNIYIVFYLFSLGLIFKYIYNQYNIERLNILYPLFGFLISATVIYGTNFDIAIAIFPNIMKTPLLFLSHDLLVLFAFIILIKLSGHNCIFITKLGVFSIAVYTIHPLVIQALKLLIQSNSFLSNLLIFILTIILTLLVIRLLQKLEIYQVVYPR